MRVALGTIHLILKLVVAAKLRSVPVYSEVVLAFVNLGYRYRHISYKTGLHGGRQNLRRSGVFCHAGGYEAYFIFIIRIVLERLVVYNRQIPVSRKIHGGYGRPYNGTVFLFHTRYGPFTIRLYIKIRASGRPPLYCNFLFPLVLLC